MNYNLIIILVFVAYCYTVYRLTPGKEKSQVKPVEEEPKTLLEKARKYSIRPPTSSLSTFPVPGPRVWLPVEHEMLLSLAGTLTANELAIRLNRPVEEIVGRAKEFSIPLKTV